MYAIPEKVRPGANPGARQTHIGGGADKLKFITMRRLLHVLDRWYPWLVLLWGVVVTIELAFLALVVTP